MKTKQATASYKYHKSEQSCPGYFRISFESTCTVVHRHENFYELMLVTEGEWQNITPAGTFTLAVGTLTLFRPGATHQLFTEPMKSKHLVVCIEAEYFESFVARCFPEFSFSSDSLFLSVTISQEKRKYLEYLGNCICQNTQPRKIVSDEILLLSISSLLSNALASTEDNYALDIMKKLDTFFYLNNSVDEICANYPYAKPLLMRQFKRVSGTTIVNYKARQKLRYAAHLLTSTNIKIIDIANILQYSSLSYFLRRFKEEYHMTPSEYRKIHQKNEWITNEENEQ